MIDFVIVWNLITTFLRTSVIGLRFTVVCMINEMYQIFIIIDLDSLIQLIGCEMLGCHNILIYLRLDTSWIRFLTCRFGNFVWNCLDRDKCGFIRDVRGNILFNKLFEFDRFIADIYFIFMIRYYFAIHFVSRAPFSKKKN